MRNYPKEDYEFEDLKKINAEDWMIECLKMNPEYNSWGPYEDYMYKEGQGWDSRIIKENWSDFGPWELNDLNEIVNFYFSVERDSKNCISCKGYGLNKKTKELTDAWYSFDKEDWIDTNKDKRYNNAAWQYHLTQVEVDALWKAGRLKGDFEEKPTPEQVNKWATTGFGHDAINRWICVKARAEKEGYYGACKECHGDGYIFTKPAAKLNITFWFLHPRKGCSRGIHIKNIEQNELPKVIEYLQIAARRNADRFSKLI